MEFNIDEAFIKKLQSYLYSKTHKMYFEHIKVTPNSIMVSCPFHKNGQERKPSCGIKKFSDESGGVGVVHCFTCGVSTNITNMLRQILGTMYDPNEIETLFHLSLISNNSILMEKEEPLFKLYKSDDNIVPESIVRRFKGIYPDYLRRRNISKEVADLYELGY